MTAKIPFFTKGFFLLNVIYFLIFSNLAIFFNYYNYLQTLDIAPEWFGILIGLDALISMILRPIISPFFTAKNAPLAILWSAVLVFLTLLGYTIAHSLIPMFLVRLTHGIGFVVISSALTVYTVPFIPPDRSSQAFGIISISFLLPYSVIPFVVEWIFNFFKSYEATFVFAALLILPVFPILFFINKRSINPADIPSSHQEKIYFKDIIVNLKDRRVVSLFVISIVTFISFSVLYFFIKSFAIHIGAKDIGYFFTIYSVTMIGVRVLAGRLFDRMNKYATFLISTIFTGLCYIFIGKVDSISMLYVYAFFFGIGIGVIIPLINGIAFEISDPNMRGLNLNLIIEMRDLGFFIGPIIATIILKHYDFKSLYLFCGCASIISMVLMPLVAKKR